LWLQHCLIFHITKDFVSFSSWESQFREVVRALVKSSRSFHQKQQELLSKATGAFVKSNKSNGIRRRDGED